MPALTICHVSPWATTCGFAQSLSYVISASPPEWRHVVLAERLPPHCVELQPGIERVWQRGPNSLDGLAQRISAAGANIVHWQWDPNFHDPAKWARFMRRLQRKGIKQVVTPHCFVVHPKYEAANRVLCSVPDLVEPTTEPMAEEIMNFAVSLPGDLWRRGKIVTVPLASDSIPCYGQTEARRRLGYASDDKLVVSVGMLGSYKGHATVYEAVRRLRMAGERIRYWVLGKALTDAHRSHLRRLEPLDRDSVGWFQVKDVWLDEMALGMVCHAADLLAFHYETSALSGSGMVRVAMAAGRPVIGSDSPMLDGLGDGVLRPKMRDVPAVQQAILDALQPERWAQLSEACLKSAATWAPDVLAKRHCELYRNLLRA